MKGRILATVLVAALWVGSQAAAQSVYGFTTPNRMNVYCSPYSGSENYATAYSFFVAGVPIGVDLSVSGKDANGQWIKDSSGAIIANVYTTTQDTLNILGSIEYVGDGNSCPSLFTDVRVHTVVICGPVPYAPVEHTVTQNGQ